jgi:hypothetical protein
MFNLKNGEQFMTFVELRFQASSSLCLFIDQILVNNRSEFENVTFGDLLRLKAFGKNNMAIIDSGPQKFMVTVETLEFLRSKLEEFTPKESILDDIAFIENVLLYPEKFNVKELSLV